MIVKTTDPGRYDPILFAPAQWRKKTAPVSRPDPPHRPTPAQKATARVPVDTTRGTRVDLYA